MNRIRDTVNALHHNPGWFLFLFVATITFAIPSQADTARWDRAWRRQVEEPAGLVRAFEPLEPDCPWITFYHDQTADAVAVIHTRYENGAAGKVKMDPPMSFIHVKGAAYNYWGRVLAGKLHRLPQAKLTKGLEWKTQSVLLVHRFSGKGAPKTLLHSNQRLRRPLKAMVLPQK